MGIMSKRWVSKQSCSTIDERLGFIVMSLVENKVIRNRRCFKPMGNTRLNATGSRHRLISKPAQYKMVFFSVRRYRFV